MPSSFTKKCATAPVKNQVAKVYETGGITFEVCCILPNGRAEYFVHEDPRKSVKTRCEELGADFEEAIVLPVPR